MQIKKIFIKTNKQQGGGGGGGGGGGVEKSFGRRRVGNIHKLTSGGEVYLALVSIH